jgi:hypothetical protein
MEKVTFHNSILGWKLCAFYTHTYTLMSSHSPCIIFMDSIQATSQTW